MNCGERAKVLTEISPSPSNWASIMSFAKTTPTISSRLSLLTGTRENPFKTATSIAAETVKVSGTLTMSGLGVITSRTRVSPKAKTEAISSCSSFSIDFDSRAFLAVSNSSFSETILVSFDLEKLLMIFLIIFAS